MSDRFIDLSTYTLSKIVNKMSRLVVKCAMSIQRLWNNKRPSNFIENIFVASFYIGNASNLKFCILSI